MFIIGLTAMLTIMLNVEQGIFVFWGLHFGVSTMALAGGLVVIGLQLIYFWMVTRHLATVRKFIPQSRMVTYIRGVATLERQLLLGATLISAGLITIILATIAWQSNQYGANGSQYFTLIIPATTASLAGIQILFGAFLVFIIDD